MEDPSGQVVIYPTVEQICQVNRRMIQEFGGVFVPPHNLLNRNTLEYVLAAVRYPVAGLGLYPNAEGTSLCYCLPNNLGACVHGRQQEDSHTCGLDVSPQQWGTAVS